MALLDKILVANRGEIAKRIIRSAKQLGIKTVAIYTETEKESGYLLLADETVSLGEDVLHTTFLNIDRIIGIALATGSSAIHPGYGFLSENAAFARACEENQLIFIGPGSEVLELMGNKPEAKRLAVQLGIPVIASYKIDFPEMAADEPIEFPVVIKASHGGGGKGIKIVHNREDLAKVAEQSSRTALNYFGNGTIFIERVVKNARHVEVQLLGDQHDQLVHLFERECSIQRNHQKIVEEAPALFLTPALRAEILAAALKIGKAVHYTGAGTVEFLVDESGNFYFLEMNPRIQVEHAVTEEVTGIDIVAEQLKIASGWPLSFAQNEVTISGHAIEVRIYTEDPAKEFIPSTKALEFIHLPVHHGLRIEADLNLKHSTGTQFDPLLLKMIAKGRDRKGAIQLLRKSIGELNVIGPETNLKYMAMILAHDQYLQNEISVEFCQENHGFLVSYSEKIGSVPPITYLIALAIVKKYLAIKDQPVSDLWKQIGYWRLTSPSIPVTVDHQLFHIQLNVNDKSHPSFRWNGKKIAFQVIHQTDHCLDISIDADEKRFFYTSATEGKLYASHSNIKYCLTFNELQKHFPESKFQQATGSNVETREIISPMHGRILEIFVKENQLIKKNDPLLVIEAMKSENKILAHMDARIRKIAVNVGSQVTDRMPLILLED